ncbi:MAG: hypothetical protein JW699_00670 [Chitinispirillaceae bacterium]|nr:hypothetical protein [Chitinispirillaceae bacterium]
MKTHIAACCAAFLTAKALALEIITPQFPIKDGHVSANLCSGADTELIADECLQMSSWMVFKSASLHYRDIRAARLAVYIKSVQKAGLCGIHSLMKKITAPERNVTLSCVVSDDMPIAALPLDSSFADQMVFIDITELVQSGAFYGITLKPMQGLSARFSSKEGFPPPAILVLRDTLYTVTPPKWWSCCEAPDTSVGKAGDFYVRASQGIVYRKSPEGMWDSVASFVIPPENPAPVMRKSVRRPLKRTR